MRSIIKLATAIILLANLNSYGNYHAHTDKIKSEVYQCSMKCEGEKTYQKPGSCSICGMELEKVNSTSKRKLSNVKIAGAMKNVMHKGELFGTISLDTISDKSHLYGIGPLEYLKGEILIYDGKSYLSTVSTSSTMQVRENYQVKAPFFVYANITKWKEASLPDSIQTILQLDSYLHHTTQNSSRPFAFKISAMLEIGDIHIVNLPAGTEIHSPEDAHKNQQTFKIINEQSEMIGFFSTEHQGIFTHHDSYIHMHLITADKSKMGHLDKVFFKPGTARLYLPEND